MSTKPRSQTSDASGVEDAWELYTLGELSKEDEAVLRALSEDEPEALERMSLHAPLDDDFRARVADGLSAQIEQQHQQQQRARRSRTLRIAAYGSALAMAAAALLVLLPRNDEQLPAYRVEATGGTQSTRGAAVERATVFLPDSELSITLTPETRVQGELVVQASLTKDGRLVPWAVPIARAPSGALRVHGRAATLLPLGFGDYRARFELKRERSEKALRTLELSFAYRPAP